MDPDSSQVGTKQKASRYTWKTFEEDHLIRCMRNEYSDKWSADNGFRSGFFTLMETKLKNLMPSTKIKASPHIESKVKYWKQTYNKINDIIRLSGFGWNDVNKCIVVDDPSVWEDYEKANPKTKGMNGKAFPYFDDWVTLFGKDSATGEFAEDPTELGEANTPIHLEEENLMFNNDCYIPMFDEHFGSSTLHSSTPPSSTTQSSTPSSATPPTSTPPTARGSTSTPPVGNPGTKKGKKRSRMSVEESSLHESMETWMKESAGHIGDIAKSMGYSKELSIRRQKVPEELGKLNLTMAEKFKLGAIICEAEERVDNFYGTPDAFKQAWAEAVLNGQVYSLSNN